MSEHVVVYSSHGCIPCEWVKKYLTTKGIVYKVRMVDEDAAAMADLTKLGFHGTPVTVIDGQCFPGFNQKKIEAALIAGGHMPAPATAMPSA